MKRLLAFSVLATLGSAQAATIYLCKACNGSMFWAQAHCNQHNAFIERMETVAYGFLGISKFSKLRKARQHVPGRLSPQLPIRNATSNAPSSLPNETESRVDAPTGSGNLLKSSIPISSECEG